MEALTIEWVPASITRERIGGRSSRPKPPRPAGGRGAKCGHRGPDVIESGGLPLCPECRQPPHAQEQRLGAPEPVVSARTPPPGPALTFYRDQAWLSEPYTLKVRADGTVVAVDEAGAEVARGVLVFGDKDDPDTWRPVSSPK